MQTVHIDKLIFGGAGLGKINDKVYFVWGALPDEDVEVGHVKEKKNFAEGVATSVLKQSPQRVDPKEAHYLSCSPWQIIDYDGEAAWKTKIAHETYQKIGGLSVDNLTIESKVNAEYHYRNKMEYSFTVNDDGNLALASYERKTHQRYAIEGCALGMPVINTTAQKITTWLRKHNIPYQSLINVVIRANDQNQTIAGLFVQDKIKVPMPTLDNELLGFHIFYAPQQSRMMDNPKKLQGVGEEALMYTLQNHKVKIGLLSFFQVNVPIFEEALLEIKRYVDKGSDVIDYYSGVGAIGISLADKIKSCILVDNNKQAIDFAKDNVHTNQLKNFKTVLGSADRLLNYVEKDRIIVFDPPRAGLHPNVVEKVLQVKPKRVIYLSCDVATHARDIKLLSQKYKISFLKLYNFFPKTPHIESLCVLDLA